MEASAGYGNLTTTGEPTIGTNFEGSAELFLFMIGGGLSAFFTEKIALETEIGYSGTSIKPNINNADAFRIVTKGIAVKIGITIVL